jgi:hypothetical protein
MIKQTVLPFKLEQTRDLITAHAGLALLGEFTIGLGLMEAVDKRLPGRQTPQHERCCARAHAFCIDSTIVRAIAQS